jgi:hypothetical protein
MGVGVGFISATAIVEILVLVVFIVVVVVVRVLRLLKAGGGVIEYLGERGKLDDI